MPDFNDKRLRRPDGDGIPRQIAVGMAAVRETPEADSRLSTQALFGELVDIYDEQDGACLIQGRRDRYVGWVARSALSRDVLPPTHKVSTPRTHAYSAPDLKSPPARVLSLGARLAVDGQEGDWLHAQGAGWVHVKHAVPVAQFESDPAGIAECFLHTPYLWGGRDSIGLDCTGLTQQAFEACGVLLPRDSDMQFAWCGDEVPDWREPGALQRGDLVFWKGHVGIMTGEAHLLHANAWHMAVACEPIETAIERIANYYAEPIGARRIDVSSERGRAPLWMSEV